MDSVYGWSIRLMMAGTLLCAVFGSVGGVCHAATLPEYTVKRCTGKIVLDGFADEEDWKSASSLGDFVFPWWISGEREQTDVRMLWNDDFLYLAFTCQDRHIWADHYDTNSATYNDDTVELFWNPNPSSQNTYYQFEINCIGNLLSVWRNGSSPRPVIMVPHISQQIYGTVNGDSDTDSLWVLEVAIRFSDYPEIGGGSSPRNGDLWRVGVNRCGGKTNPQYSQWSPSQTSSPNFHRPDDFGRLVFSSEPVRGTVSTGESAKSTPITAEIRGNHPNPFNLSTVIDFTLSQPGLVWLEIFSVSNQRIRVLADGFHEAGGHSVRWDGRDDRGRPVSSGTYLVHLRAGGKESSRKILLMK